MAQAHDTGRRKAEARLEAAQQRAPRISRTAVEKLAAELVRRGVCSPSILETRNFSTNRRERP